MQMLFQVKSSALIFVVGIFACTSVVFMIFLHLRSDKDCDHDKDSSILSWRGFNPLLTTREPITLRRGPCIPHCDRGECDEDRGICTWLPGYAGSSNEFSKQSLFGRQDPYANLTLLPKDVSGWFNTHDDFWPSRIREYRPRLVVEVGVWLGSTVTVLAKEMKKQLGGGVVLAVDTWSGALEFWKLNDAADTSHDLRLVNGYPTVYYQFLSNMVHENVSDMVIPFPVPSSLASEWLKGSWPFLGIDLIHIDGSHEYHDVVDDICRWWPLVNYHGVMIGDDYSSHWPGVVQAVDEFAERVSFTHRLYLDGTKWWFVLRHPFTPL